MATEPFYIHTNSAQTFQFLHILVKTSLLLCDKDHLSNSFQ